MIVAKKVEFDAAHFLPNYAGKCKNMHGHRWEVEVAVEGKVIKRTGMVVDFVELKGFLKWVEEKFDHKVINDVIENPTAENIAQYILDEFTLWCTARGLKVRWVKVWESEDSYVHLELEE